MNIYIYIYRERERERERENLNEFHNYLFILSNYSVQLAFTFLEREWTIGHIICWLQESSTLEIKTKNKLRELLCFYHINCLFIYI